MPPSEAADMLLDEDTLATTLLVWALDEFGPELLGWHPATIRREVEATAGVPIRDDNFDRLMAAVAVVSTDLFFKNAAAFAQLAPALCGDGFDPGEFDPPDAAECAWAIVEALLVSPPDDDDAAPFSEDVRRFVGHVLREEGFTSAPDVLAIALDTGELAAGLDDDVRAASSEAQAQREDDIKSVVREGLRALGDQLSRLTLRHGDASEIVAKVRAAI
jgi:hypothetical protein